MKPDHEKKPSGETKGAWLLATIGMAVGAIWILVLQLDQYLVAAGLPTISRRLLELSIRQPWTAGVISFVAMLPLAGLGGHLWLQLPWGPRAAGYWSVAGVGAAMIVGLVAGSYWFGQE
jgi:hypothetical protein